MLIAKGMVILTKPMTDKLLRMSGLLTGPTSFNCLSRKILRLNHI
jgi:hypothetical protein